MSPVTDNPFETNVQHIEERFRDGFPQGKILLFGSSFMEFWYTSSHDLHPLETINIGIGGTRIEDWTSFYSRIILPFQPCAMVAYVGSNNISGDETSMTSEQVFEKLIKFFTCLDSVLPGIPLYYISIAPTIARWHVWQHASRANQLIQAYCDTHASQYSFINCTPALLTQAGLPLPDIFMEDQLHFNARGYKIWQSVIYPYLMTHIAPERFPQ